MKRIKMFVNFKIKKIPTLTKDRGRYTFEGLARRGEGYAARAKEEEDSGWVVTSPLVSYFKRTSKESVQV